MSFELKTFTKAKMSSVNVRTEKHGPELDADTSDQPENPFEPGTPAAARLQFADLPEETTPGPHRADQ